jgi:hypothetical protein
LQVRALDVTENKEVGEKMELSPAGKVPISRDSILEFEKGWKGKL